MHKQPPSKVFESISESRQSESRQQVRTSNGQVVIAMLVLLLACGLSFASYAAPVDGKADKEGKNRSIKSSPFCIFGVDDLKLRSSAGRSSASKIKPIRQENGDCWVSKPGQMA